MRISCKFVEVSKNCSQSQQQLRIDRLIVSLFSVGSDLSKAPPFPPRRVHSRWPRESLNRFRMKDKMNSR